MGLRTGLIAPQFAGAVLHQTFLDNTEPIIPPVAIKSLHPSTCGPRLNKPEIKKVFHEKQTTAIHSKGLKQMIRVRGIP